MLHAAKLAVEGTAKAGIYGAKTIAASADFYLKTLENAMITLRGAGDVISESAEIRDRILPIMCGLRIACDEADTLTAKSYWPFPTYGDILFSVK